MLMNPTWTNEWTHVNIFLDSSFVIISALAQLNFRHKFWIDMNRFQSKQNVYYFLKYKRKYVLYFIMLKSSLSITLNSFLLSNLASTCNLPSLVSVQNNIVRFETNIRIQIQFSNLNTIISSWFMQLILLMVM